MHALFTCNVQKRDADADQSPSRWEKFKKIVTPQPHQNEQPKKDGESNEPTDDKMKEQTDAKAKKPTGNEAKKPTGNEAKEPTGNEAKEPTGNEAKEPTDKSKTTNATTNEPTVDIMKEQADGAKVHRPIRMFTSCNLVLSKVPVLYNGLHALFTCNVQKRDADPDQPSFFKKLFTSQSHPSEQPKKDDETKKQTDDRAMPEQADAKPKKPTDDKAVPEQADATSDGAKVRIQTCNAKIK